MNTITSPGRMPPENIKEWDNQQHRRGALMSASHGHYQIRFTSGWSGGEYEARTGDFENSKSYTVASGGPLTLAIEACRIHWFAMASIRAGMSLGEVVRDDVIANLTRE